MATLDEVESIRLYPVHSQATSDTLICYGIRKHKNIPIHHQINPMQYAMLTLMNMNLCTERTNMQLLTVKELKQIVMTIKCQDQMILNTMKKRSDEWFMHVLYQNKMENGQNTHNQQNYRKDTKQRRDREQESNQISELKSVKF